MEAAASQEAPRKTAVKYKKKTNESGGRRDFHDPADYSRDESSDDDQHMGDMGDDDDFAKFCGLSQKFRQIIHNQRGAEFSAFFKPHALHIATIADLYEVLTHFRSGMQCARGLCRVNNLPIQSRSSPELFQAREIPIVVPRFRAHSHLSIPMTQRVALAAIRQFLQASSIVAYTNGMAAKTGSVKLESADGHLAREILSMGLGLASIFDECHPFPTVFLNVLERLFRRLLVHEDALALDKKEWSAFYEKNLPFIGLASAPSWKSLKHLACQGNQGLALTWPLATGLTHARKLQD